MKAVYARRVARQLRCGLFTGLLGLATLWCIGGLGTNPADGYVLEGTQVLKLMAGKLSGVKSLRVDQQVTVEDPAISGEPMALDETLSFLFPGNFRSDILHQNTRRIHVVSQGQTLTVVDDKITANPEGHHDQYKDLLLYNSAHMLQKILYIHGVDVGITSMGRLADQIVFVIGANYPDESVSQVWVDKEQFFPLRWLSVQPDGGPSPVDDRWEFLYSNWQKVDGAYYPFKIEAIHNRQRISLIRVIKADANAILDAELFNIAHLQSTYKIEEIQTPNDERTSTGVDEVQRTIDEFKKKFEP